MTTNSSKSTPPQQSCIVLCTTNSQENAIKIAQHLLDNQLAACVSLLPEIMSLYLWQGNITKDKEILLLIKTTQSNQLSIFEAIKKIHPYETPELIRLDPSQVEDNYLQWLINSVK
ncbi:divalent-cation tolerance protein CutA [Providencia sp. R33]|uniref:divalent-cation tolerance protein CutA n=1 Tax=Providencia sp. R33 TaxID=2828763 RepID=UPI001C5BA25E|nr:divalent-cation tolerance protein CutA [Providencia sp. R33]QXX84686.1 divalent-cation tolerance protein CutA [Providencia sp. R33]